MSTADNQIFSGSQVIASDENNGVHFPINKLAYSDDQGNIIFLVVQYFPVILKYY